MIENPRWINPQGDECPMGTTPDTFMFDVPGGVFRPNNVVESMVWNNGVKEVRFKFPCAGAFNLAAPTADKRYMAVCYPFPYLSESSVAFLLDDDGNEIFRLKLPKIYWPGLEIPKNTQLIFSNVRPLDREDHIEFWINFIDWRPDFFVIKHFNYKTFEWDEEYQTICR